MEFQNVKAACKSGGKKAELSTEFDDQAGDDSPKREQTDNDSDDFMPISRMTRLGRWPLDPFIPGPWLLGAGAVVMT